MPTKTPSRLERRKAQTRASILDAASSLFHDQGFEPTSIQQIAEVAGIGVGTLYGYFASKEDVLAAVIRVSSEAAVARYRGVVTEGMTTAQKFMVALDFFADYIRTHRGELRAATRLRGSPAAGAETPGFWIYEAFRAQIAAGVANGEFRAVPVDTMARTVVMNYLMALLGFGLWQGHEDDPEVVEELRELVRRSLLP